MQKEMATIEQVAQDNHERARRLMKELNQMQHEYSELKKQVCPGAPAGRSQTERTREACSLPMGSDIRFLIPLLRKYLFVEIVKLTIRISCRSNLFFSVLKI